MFNWLRKKFRRQEIKPLSLSFEMDRTDDGKHIVRVIKNRQEAAIPIDDVTSLWQYGYQEIEETPNGNVIYILNEKDRQTLLSLRSMNPQVDENGRLQFDFAPPILNYLRTKENLAETPDSKKLKVLKKPLKPIANVDFDSQKGITVKTGFRNPESNELVSVDSLEKTADGKYMMVGDTFTPLPPPPNEAVKKWWDQPNKKVPLYDIPEFFQRDLVLLKKEFTAVLTDRANQIQIINESFKPVVKVDKNERGWLDFEVGYEVGEMIIPHSMFTKISEKPYIQVGDATWIKNDQHAIQKTERQLKKIEAEITASGYRTRISEFASLDEFIQSIDGKAKLSAAYQAFLDQLTDFRERVAE